MHQCPGPDQAAAQAMIAPFVPSFRLAPRPCIFPLLWFLGSRIPTHQSPPCRMFICFDKICRPVLSRGATTGLVGIPSLSIRRAAPFDAPESQPSTLKTFSLDAALGKINPEHSLHVESLDCCFPQDQFLRRTKKQSPPKHNAVLGFRVWFRFVFSYRTGLTNDRRSPFGFFLGLTSPTGASSQGDPHGKHKFEIKLNYKFH